MLPSKYHTISVQITKPKQIIRFSETLPNNLVECNGLQLSTGYQSLWGYSSTEYSEQYSAGTLAIEFDKKEIYNIPVLSSYNQINHRGFFIMSEPLSNTLVTGYYRDCGLFTCPYVVSIYLRCTYNG